MILYVMLICQVVSMESIHETRGVNTGHIILSINSSISYGGFNTKRYNIMFVQYVYACLWVVWKGLKCTLMQRSRKVVRNYIFITFNFFLKILLFLYYSFLLF